MTTATREKLVAYGAKASAIAFAICACLTAILGNWPAFAGFAAAAVYAWAFTVMIGIRIDTQRRHGKRLANVIDRAERAEAELARVRRLLNDTKPGGPIG
jgi:hypothetical protein